MLHPLLAIGLLCVVAGVFGDALTGKPNASQAGSTLAKAKKKEDEAPANNAGNVDNSQA